MRQHAALRRVQDLRRFFKGSASKKGSQKAPSIFLRFSAKIFGFLRKSAVFCGFLRPPKCLNFHRKGRICEILWFSAKFCVLGSLSLSLCHLKRAQILRVSVGTKVLRRVLGKGGVIEEKAL